MPKLRHLVARSRCSKCGAKWPQPSVRSGRYIRAGCGDWIGEIFAGPAIGQLFNLTGLPPNGDPRRPDIILTPNIGVTYSGSHAKLAEHGGFSHDDTKLIMLVSNPSFSARMVTSPVETAQIAATILAALGLNPEALQSVQHEHTQVLPAVPLDFDRH